MKTLVARTKLTRRDEQEQNRKEYHVRSNAGYRKHSAEYCHGDEEERKGGIELGFIQPLGDIAARRVCAVCAVPGDDSGTEREPKSAKETEYRGRECVACA